MLYAVLLNSIKMREILFRGKVKDKWCVGSLLVGWAGTCQIWEKDNDNALHNFIVDEKTVGQYTGVVDSLGKRIFEHDVIKVYRKEEPERTYHTFIVFRDGVGDFVQKDCRYASRNTTYPIAYYGNRFEVVGNIIDNPEFIENGRTT